MITEAIVHRTLNGSWNPIAYVIMPDHLHLFVETGGGLLDVMRDFKRWTGHEGRRVTGRRGRFWQVDWFDHWSRSPAEDERIIRYIRQNPVRAGLVQDARDWPYGAYPDGHALLP